MISGSVRVECPVCGVVAWFPRSSPTRTKSERAARVSCHKTTLNELIKQLELFKYQHLACGSAP